MLKLIRIKRTDPRILKDMENHYSKPKGFVGRNICYAIMWNDDYYGSIVGGSATLHLPGRNEFLIKFNGWYGLNNIVNNIFFHIEKKNDKYPTSSFSKKIIKLFEKQIKQDWKNNYGDRVLFFETLVELPRTGETYLRCGYKLVGQTKGFTCKRVGGISTDAWSGRRVWDYKNLRPKLVFYKLAF